MTHPKLTHPRRNFIAIVAFAMVLSTAAVAAGATRDAADLGEASADISLRSGEVATAEGIDRAGLDAALESSATGSVHYLVRLVTIPDSAERAALARRGLTLVQYVGDGAYIATSRAFGIGQLQGMDRLQAAVPLRPTDKVATELANGQIAPWATAPDGRVALTIVGHADVRASDLAKWVESNGGEVVDTVASTPAVTALFADASPADVAADDSVQWVDVADAPLEDHNDGAVPALNVPPVYAAPYGGGTGLDGSGVTILVYDSGIIDTHPDFGTRIVEFDGDATETTRNHSTHVAGTAAGDGSNSNGNDSVGNPNGGAAGQWAGVAPNASIRSFGSSGSTDVLYNSPGDINADFTTAITNGTDLATMSQGNNVVRNGFPCAQLGDYTSTAILLDNIVRGSINGQQLIYFQSAGNERGGAATCGTTYSTISSPATAKNTIVVGAIRSNNNTMTGFSSWGPTDDGRMSPDVVGPGCQAGGDGTITSPGFDDAVALGGDGDGNLDAGETRFSYVGMCGTSMATPAVAGVGALLIEQWRTTRGAAATPLGHTMMAIMAHTANDLGNAGPDYQFGYGQVDAQTAADLIIADDSADLIHVNSVDQGDTVNYTFVSDGTAAPRVTLAWSDPPAAALAATTLVNDLDVQLVDPDGIAFQPYTLNPASPANVATTGINTLDNSEMIDGAAKAGTWVVTVSGSTVPTGPQQYTLITPEDTAEGNLPPVADANGPYNVDEGATVALDAGGSIDPDGDVLSFAWDFDADGAFDDAVGSNPTFGPRGDDGVQIVSVRVTDSHGAFDDAGSVVVIGNVAPTVTIDGSQTTTIDEGDFLAVLANFTDPGWLDTYNATIDWGTGDSGPGNVVITVNGPPADVGTVTGSFQYGDNGGFTVTVTVTDDDGGFGSDAFALTVNNVAPTPTIDESGTVLVNGVPTIVAHAGDPVDFDGNVTDPGSDDIDVSWDWDDGPPSPDVTTTYLVNPPGPDPLPSPSVQPRNIDDMQTHGFDDACIYDVGLSALDDDGGTGEDEVKVLIQGNASKARSVGYWYQQYRQGPAQKIDDATLECYLEIVEFMSDVFNEERDASTIDDAKKVLRAKFNKTMRKKLDRQLLGALLNFANGAVELDELIDTDGNGTDDTAFYDAIVAAETVRLDPTATKSELEEQKDIMERINLMDK